MPILLSLKKSVTNLISKRTGSLTKRYCDKKILIFFCNIVRKNVSSNNGLLCFFSVRQLISIMPKILWLTLRCVAQTGFESIDFLDWQIC
jgi:hypothetical protein